MSVTAFRPMTWQPMELITDVKMDRMTQNEEFLSEYLMGTSYRGFGSTRDKGIKLACGLVSIGTSKGAEANKDVRFGNFFSSGCNPIVTTGLVSSHQHRIHLTIDGLGQLHPDQRGFQVHVRMDSLNKKKNRITHNFYVSWHAMGY